MKRAISVITVILIFQIGANAQSCLPNGITFSQQSEIDNFQNNYPNCSKVEGDVIIEASFGHHIYDLNGLSNIEEIGGDFTISSNYDLVNLHGLDNLKIIGGRLKVNGNSLLQNFLGLDSLEHVGADILIYSNNITTLYGLGNIGLISGNLEIIQNSYLTSLEGLNILHEIGGDLIISSNSALANITGLESLDHIGGSLTFDFNPILTSLTGLENLDVIHGDLMIHENFHLTNLEGLNNITMIDGNLEIFDCLDLQNLVALGNLNSINGDLIISFSASLASLSGLDSIDATTINNLILTDNSLSICNIKSICDYISNPIGSLTIDRNRPGCNSETEIEEACIANTNESLASDVTIYPNPTSNIFSIIGDDKINKCIVYNQFGCRVLIIEKDFNEVSVSMLSKGLFVIVIFTDEYSLRKKLVIE